MSGRFITGGHRDSAIPAYSDRARMHEGDDAPLPIEHVVAIQQLAARGYDVDRIVQELAKHRIRRDEVVRILTPAEQATPRKPYRPARANVGYAHVKRGLPGYGR